MKFLARSPRLLLAVVVGLLLAGAAGAFFFYTYPTLARRPYHTYRVFKVIQPKKPASRPMAIAVPPQKAKPTVAPTAKAQVKADPQTTAATGTGSAPAAIPPVGSRDPLTWPFASNSIWNMPLGSNAQYVDAPIGSRNFSTDTDWLITAKAGDPKVPMYTPPTFSEGRCSGTLPEQQAQWHPEAAQPISVP